MRMYARLRPTPACMSGPIRFGKDDPDLERPTISPLTQNPVNKRLLSRVRGHSVHADDRPDERPDEG
jgi:hypothetical protein